MTILFAYLRTGGGHLAPARALAGVVERLSGGRSRCVLADGMERSSRLARWILEDGYRILQSRARWAYALLYLLNSIPAVSWWSTRLVISVVKPWLRECIARERPDRIVVVHFLLVRPVVEALRAEGRTIPVTVLVTDPFTAHPFWFRDRTLSYIVFSDHLRARCLRLGIPPERVAVYPFPLGEAFGEIPGTEEIRRLKVKHGFAPDRKVVLVLGGGDGIPRGARILRVLAHGVAGAQLAIVCGRNAALQRRAAEVRRATGREDIRVFGYVDFARELILCADVVVSKCGASAFMEILLSGRLPVITDYLWKQEQGNRDFLVQSRTGVYEPRIRRLPALVRRLITDETLVTGFRENLRSLTLRNGTLPLAQHLLQITPPL